MQFLTKSASAQWWQTHAANSPQSVSAATVVEFGNFERELGGRIYFLLTKALDEAAPNKHLPLLLLVQETGVWPSNEHLLLYSLIRNQFGSSESIEGSPGHLASGTERDYVLAVAFLCVLYGWGFIATGAESSFSLFVDHDGNWKVLRSK